jgi:Cu(I)/Ag(I) efflux system protein CusF
MNIRTFIAVAAIALAALGSSAAIAQTDEFIAGQVTKVDEPAGKHGPIKKFDMDEGMTMVFRAGDPAMLKMVKAGDKVRFIPDRVNGQFTVMKIENAK